MDERGLVTSLIDSASIKAVMESPVPIAALAIVMFIAWRQMSLVKSTVNTTLSTMAKLFQGQNERQDKFMKEFRDTAIQFNKDITDHKLAIGKELTTTNILVSDLNGKLSRMEHYVEDLVERKLSGLKTTGEAVERRIRELEAAQAKYNETFEAVQDRLRKRGGAQ